MTIDNTPSGGARLIKVETSEANLSPHKPNLLTDLGPRRRLGKKLKKPVEQHEHFLALTVDEDGVVQLRASPSLKQHKAFLLEEAFTKLTQYLSDVSFVIPHASPDESMCQGTMMARPTNLPPTPNSSFQQSSGSISYPFERPPKRHRSGTIHGQTVPDEVRGQESPQHTRVTTQRDLLPTVSIEVSNHVAMEKWFGEAFKAVQQVGCRLVAKVWIKKIHPKKQSTHPYNGRPLKDGPRDSNEARDPNKTRPPYWPPGVTHKEPDHICRAERTALLVHLIMNTPQKMYTNPPDAENQVVITAQDLLDCLEEKKKEFKPGRWQIIQEIVHARTYMERYLDQGLDANTTLCLHNYSDSSRLAQVDLDTEVLDQNMAGDGPHEDEEFTTAEPQLSPVSPAVTSPARQIMSAEDQQRVSTQNPSFSQPLNGSDMRQEHGRRPLDPAPVPTQRTTPVSQEMSPKVSMPMASFGGNMENGVHEAIVYDPRTASRLFDVSQETGPPHNFALQPWAAIVPPGMYLPETHPPDHMFVHPSMSMLQPTNRENPIFPPCCQDLTTPATAHGLPLMDTMDYHDFDEGHRHTLPVRPMSSPHPGLMGLVNLEIGMMQAPFYPA